MDMEHIKPSTMPTLRAISYSTPHLLMLFIDPAHFDAKYCNQHTKVKG